MNAKTFFAGALVLISLSAFFTLLVLKSSHAVSARDLERYAYTTAPIQRMNLPPEPTESTLGMASSPTPIVSLPLLENTELKVVKQDIAIDSKQPKSLPIGAVSTSIPVPAPPILDEQDEWVPVPETILFNRLGKSSPILVVGQDESGTIEIPSTAKVVCMFRGGSSPGYPGNTLLIAHNNYEGEIGIFSYLYALEKGDVITFSSSEGVLTQCEVTDKDIYPFDHLPSNLLDFSGESRVTMLSCYGPFDRKIGTAPKRCVIIAKPITNGESK